MELYDMLHPMLELSISIPAIILCFLPMKNHLNGKGRLLLLWGIPTLILWCVGAGWLCWRLRYSTKLCMLLTQALLLLFYCKHRLTRAHREKQLKMSCQALHNAPPNRT